LADWSKLPDVLAVALLTVAFASVARNARKSISGLWLIGWLMIVLHFLAYMFLTAAGRWSDLANFIGTSALACGGALFMWASVPYRKRTSSQWMLALLLGANTTYIGVCIFSPSAAWALTLAAALFGVFPFAIVFLTLSHFSHPLRWTTAILYAALAIFLLIVQNRSGGDMSLPLNAVLFTVYFGCFINFCYTYWRRTAGAFITVAGFFFWASVFIVGPCIFAFFPNLHLENEVWNLPKYLVAIGMILLLLEDQIEHNKYLALHDELTGLPNRRLFQDRLANALERARRAGSQAALLLIDLDYFKQVNDTKGHHIGDQLLKKVSDIFTERVRRSDTVARTGGDEFSIILEEPTSPEDALHVGQSLAKLLDRPFQLGEHSVRVGASVGIAVFPQDASDAESLCIAADLRMYAGKQQSRRSGEVVLNNTLIRNPFSDEITPTGFQLAE